MPTALLVSPHPDDELLGCPAHLFALRDSGWRIVNLPVSYGSAPERREQRRRELEAACRAAGFELLDAPADLQQSQEGRDEQAAAASLASLAAELETDLLCAPSPHDLHPLHEWCGRVAVEAFERGAGERLWLWSIWGPLPVVNSVCSFEPRRLNEIDLALKAHIGETDRADLPRLLRAQAEADSVLLGERAFPFGGRVDLGTLAEGVLEVMRSDGLLRMCAPSLFDPRSLPDAATGPGVDSWLRAPSASALLAGG